MPTYSGNLVGMPRCGVWTSRRDVPTTTTALDHLRQSVPIRVKAPAFPKTHFCQNEPKFPLISLRILKKNEPKSSRKRAKMLTHIEQIGMNLTRKTNIEPKLRILDAKLRLCSFQILFFANNILNNGRPSQNV
jgi:hypothetical protein